jgi:hypothetical protein
MVTPDSHGDLKGEEDPMGLIRKALFIGTAGAVAPNSKKQRVAKQTLAAVQGKSTAEVEHAGTRRAALGITGAPRRRGGPTEADVEWARARLARLNGQDPGQS